MISRVPTKLINVMKKEPQMASTCETLAKGYDVERTALPFVDPYNDFLSEGGKLWPMVADVANAVGLHGNLRAITAAVHKTGIPIFIVPHHHAEPDDFVGWDHPSPISWVAPRNKPSPRVAGAASGIPILRQFRVIPSSRNTGRRTASPILISIICCNKSGSAQFRTRDPDDCRTPNDLTRAKT